MLRLAFILLCWCTFPMAAAPIIITGTLTGSDGKPMEKAHIHLAEGAAESPLKTVEAGKDGSYRIEADDSSPYFFIQFTGASHTMESVPVLLEKKENVELNVQLQANIASENIKGVIMIGDFNNYDIKSGIAMQQQPDGTYTTDFTTDKKNFTYQVIVPNGSESIHSFNGTAYDDLIYDGGGDYRSVLTVKNGSVHVVFDPKRLPRAIIPAAVQFGAKSRYMEKFSLGAKEAMARESVLITLFDAAYKGGDTQAPGKELGRTLQNLAGRIEKENDQQARQYLLMFYLKFAILTRDHLDSTISSFVTRAFREIPAESSLWNYNPSLHYMMHYTADSTKSEEYLAAMLKTPSPRILEYAMGTAFYLGHKAESEHYYTILVEQFPQSKEAATAREKFSPDRAVKNGKKVPAFSVVSLDDKKQIYSDESLKGKYYLIDFWATWCGPCVQEMENLHKAYEQYKDRNFEIISLSFDGTPGKVKEFRGKKWSMPWLHTFVEGGPNSEISKRFEVAGLPRPILVDPNGIIVATDADLRGEKLQQTLAKLLDPARTSNR